jgi:hypothetical protein
VIKIEGYKPEQLNQDVNSKLRLNSKNKPLFLELGCLDSEEGGEFENEQSTGRKTTDQS